MHLYPGVWVVFLLLAWVIMHPTREWVMLRAHHATLCRPLLVSEVVTAAIAASGVGLLNFYYVRQPWGRVAIFCMLLAITVFVPLTYLFAVKNATTRRILVGQHITSYMLLWSGVPWAMGLVGYKTGGAIVAMCLALILMLGGFGVGTLVRSPAVSIAAGFMFAASWAAWYTDVSALYTLGGGVMAVVASLSRPRSKEHD